MKVWTKVHLKEQDREVEVISKALTNYLYALGPIDDITRKYNISEADRKAHDQYTANRIAGLLMLYLAQDTSRIHDIANKYNFNFGLVKDINPEIEGYINK